MKSKVSCVVLLCVRWGTAFGQTPPTMDCDANEACVALWEQAQKQSKAGQLAEAEKSYRLAYEVSHDARLLFSIARVLDKRGKGPEATLSMTDPVVSTTERKDTPVYKKGWFWGVMAGSAAAVGLGIGLGVGLGSRGPTVPSGTNVFEPKIP